VAAIFFSFLYVDTHAYDQVEHEVADLVETMPAGQRVVASIADSGTPLPALSQVVDRSCIGHCFSYGNYEAATGQFRIRADQPNPVVASSMNVVQEIEQGRHVVTEKEAPLYAVCQCAKENPRLCLRMLRAGETTCSVTLQITPELWSRNYGGPPGRQPASRLALVNQKNQRKIPSDQNRIPAVDPPDDPGAAGPHAESTQQDR